jgi:menaquinone-dependent protoporphyrinogen oxidase
MSGTDRAGDSARLKEIAMARILVLFGTTDGQTARIAGSLAEAIHDAGHTADLVDASHGGPAPDEYDGVIVAASVHAGGYQRPVERWLRAHAAALVAQRSAFVSVCLGVLQHDPKVDAELERIRRRFFDSTGWRPETVHVVAGALPYTKYNWLKRWMMRRIVAKAGGDTDVSRDYEYTDWDDVRRFGSAFAVEAARRRARRTA